MTTLRQGDIRHWSCSDKIQDVPVEICGLAVIPEAVLGQGYVVELLKPIEGYNYTHAVAFELHLH